MQGMHIELAKLRHIVELARTRNYVRAAEALHLSQPALTRSIQSVEKQLGVRLFDRDRSGVRPTLVGEELVRRAQSLLQESIELSRSVRQLSGGGQVRLAFGIAPSLADAILEPLLFDLVKGAPGLSVHVPVNPGGALMTMLTAEEIEFFIASAPMIPDWHLYTQARPLAQLSVIAAVRAGHPLTRSPSWEDDPASADYPLISYAEPGSGMLPVTALARGFDVTTADHRTLLRLTRENDSIWIVPFQSIRAEIEQGHVVPLATREPMRFQAAAFSLKRRTLSPLAERVIAQAGAMLGTADPDPRFIG